MEILELVITVVGALIGGFVVLAVSYGMLRLIIGWTYSIPQQGQALVRTGVGGIRISFDSGIFVFPVIHRLEVMDIGVKRVEIHREGSTGLICKDNLRADIKVTFYVRVDSKSPEHVKAVAQILGCVRASDPQVLAELFEPKFSDALKTAGRDFNFEDLLNKRAAFRDAIKTHVGTDLNGYVLDDAAIDILEQTKVDKLDPNNILDSEGIKLITERTATQAILTNERNRDKEREINKKNVETREIVLEQNKQLAEAEQKQQREVASIKAREEAETIKFQQEQRLRHEKARIATDEEIAVSEENKNRQIIVAARNRERTDAVEKVRVEKDRQLEDVERDKVVSLASIEKTKVVETEQKNIQEVIRARVAVQKDVVAEEQRIKDTEAFATADREKKVVLTMAEAEAEQAVVKQVKAAEAAKKAAELKADQDLLVALKAAEAARQAATLLAEKRVTEAAGEQDAAVKIATGKKALAEGITAEQAAAGLAEANVISAKAAALQKQGETEASVAQLKFQAEADGITKKAEAMKLFHEAGRQHEEFKLRLGVEKDVTLADIAVRKEIAASQAQVLGGALSNARVDIVGGETQFFNSIVNAVTGGKAVDRAVENSRVLSDVRATFLTGDAAQFGARLKELAGQLNVSSADVKNLTVAAALAKLAGLATGADAKRLVRDLLAQAKESGIDGQLAGELLDGKQS
ncbi:MAG TPA: flotillin family protein [bacterium]|nr:flotillin family protein [bacterium]